MKKLLVTIIALVVLLSACTQVSEKTPTDAPSFDPDATLDSTSTSALTSVPTLFPTPTLGSTGELQPIPTGYVYLGEVDELALGFNMDAGGALGSLLLKGQELVDDTDYGRYIQFSMYDGNDSYAPLGSDPYGNWGWNPIQAGSKAGGGSIIGAKVLEYRTSEGSIYIKSLGKEWGQYDQDSDVVYETWAWQRDGYFEVYTRATHTGNDTHASYTQEFPAAYFAFSLTRMYGYFGESPFTGAPITELDHIARNGEIAGVGNCPPISPTENWAAFGTSEQYGLVLAVPPQNYLGSRWNICLLYDQPQVGYIGPLAYFDVPPNSVRELTYFLIPGQIEKARAIVYALMPHTSWTFELNSLEGWQSISTQASVTDGVNTVYLSPGDWLTSPGDLRLSGAITSIILNGRSKAYDKTVCLNFITTVDPTWDSEKSECLKIAPDDFQSYEFHLQNNPAWDGKLVTQLRMSADLPTWLEMDSIQASSSGAAWEFEVPGDNEGWVAWNDLDPFVVKGGSLSTNARGNDPYMNSPGILIDAARTPIVEIRMKISAGGDAQIFFISQDDDYFVEEKSILFSPIADGQFHTYTLDMSTVELWQGTIKQFRLDPTNDKTAIEIDYLRVIEKP